MGSSKKPNKQVYGEKQNIITWKHCQKSKSARTVQNEQRQHSLHSANPVHTDTTNTVTLAVCIETMEFIKQGNGES